MNGLGVVHGPQGLGDAGTRLAVAVGVVGFAHALVFGAVAQQRVQGLGDFFDRCAHQANRARRHGFGAFGGFAHDQHGLAQRRRFFLNAAAVGEDDVGAAHQVHKGQILLRLDQHHVVNAFEQAVHGLLHLRVEVHGVHDLAIWVGLCGQGQGMANALKAIAKAFAAVAGDQDQPLAGVQKRELRLHGL